MNQMNDIDLKAKEIRRIIIKESYRAHVGHIGSALSIADILAAVYFGRNPIRFSQKPDQDYFVLSKGHAALALYAVLNLLGKISDEDLERYCADDTYLGVHPNYHVSGIDFSTGSLGQGFSFGVGTALAAKMKKNTSRTFAVISDGECDEGSVWESMMFAAQHQLSNLILIIDNNGQQALGYTRDVLDISPLAEKWKSFGWDVHEADGNNGNVINEILENLNYKEGKPHVIVAHTIFGKGVSYMENRIKWHYWPMNEDEYHLAMKEIEAGS